MTRPGLAFLDTETTGLDAGDVVWEVGMYLRSDATLTDQPMVFHIAGLTVDDFSHPRALQIGGFEHRYGNDAQLIPEYEAAHLLHSTLASRHIVGANPAFDARFLTEMFARYGLEPSWNHRLIDVEVLAMGAERWLAPLGLSDTAEQLGIRVSRETLHTAMGDADLARQIYDQIIYGETR